MWCSERNRPGFKGRIKRIVVASRRQSSLRNAAALAGIWLCYAGGAAVGALLKLSWELCSLLLPIVLLTFLAAANLCKPTLLQARGESSS